MKERKLLKQLQRKERKGFRRDYEEIWCICHYDFKRKYLRGKVQNEDVEEVVSDVFNLFMEYC